MTKKISIHNAFKDFFVSKLSNSRIPDYQIKKEIEKQIPNKDELIVVYCATGHRSQRTQQILEDMGYTNVYNVYEGIII